MEFLRFGSSIPGAYWGCCAVDIIQNFCYDPDEKSSIEFVDGDGGNPCGFFLGKTWREIFHSRLRIGTFSGEDMPNHVFLAILTEEQLDSGAGQAWLRILHSTGFEFIRTTDNSVYSGPYVDEPGGSPHRNYLFGLFRNIGYGAVPDPFQPPWQWTDLGPEKNTREAHLEQWHSIGPAKKYSEAELEAEDIPIWYAGRRSLKPQQLKQARLAVNDKLTQSGTVADPFGMDEYGDEDDIF